MITFNRVFLLTPEGNRLMISKIVAWGPRCETYMKGATWISAGCGSEESSYVTNATVEEIDEAICLAHDLKPGAPMMCIDHVSGTKIGSAG